MAEWLILLLLVPAIVAPVVLLVGFAGCDIVLGLKRGPSVITSAEGTSVLNERGLATIAVTLTWTHSYGSEAAQFQFEREKLPDQTRVRFFAASSPFDDTRVEPATSYLYRVRPILSDGEPAEWSGDRPNVVATTPPLEQTFVASLEGDELGWQGYCIVQRIEAAELSKSGTTRVRLTLRGSSGFASIERIYISRPNPAGDPYDSADDIKEVPLPSTPFVLPIGGQQLLPLEFPLEYDLYPGQPLLIAVDLSESPPSTIRYADPAPPRQAVAYYRTRAALAQPNQAAEKDRTAPYTERQNRIYLIEKIEVG